tara:strand:+ start:3768 stop:4913 length:1146 start_codon:yes stop_codon:yes gene_type:complete
MKINLIIFLALISISCSSNESDESIKIEGNISPTQTPVSMKEKKVATELITPTKASKPLATSKPATQNNYERKLLPTVKPATENKKKTTFYPTAIPTITPTPTPTYPANAIVFESLEFELYIREKIDKDYITLEDISKIKEIKIGGQIGQTNLNNKISMENINDLKYFKNLEELTIREAGIKDINGIEELQNLEHLDLTGNDIEDIERIALLRNLEHLYMYDNKISDIWAFTPQRNPYLKHLWLDGNNIQSLGPFIPSINEFAGQLTHIGISRNPILSENWEQAFNENVRTLQIGGLEIDNKILKELFSQNHGFPNLGYINLGGNKKISDLSPLLKLKSLKEISIEKKVQGSALDALMRDGGIEELEKNGVNVNFVNWNYD